MMGKSLRCRVRFHKWVRMRNADGDYFRRCARCGQDWSGIEAAKMESGP